MKCITVYTNSYEAFSDVYEKVLNENLGEYEEKEVEGITVSDAGSVPEEYIERMRTKPDVAVMTIKRKGITIFQHGDVFEMLIPEQQAEKEAVHV
ncbi:MAG: NAD/NADP transhydrogenase alpha subunit [Clostridia bacterium]